MINYYKGKFERGELTIVLFLGRLSNLFRYDKANKKNRLVIPENFSKDIPPNLQLSVSIFKISNQSYNYIQNYIKSNSDYMVDLVKQFRGNLGLCYYNNQNYDLTHNIVLQKWSCLNGTCLFTTGNGDCL